jgi:enamine deaminase RidA (YjgF/YER057c/UK114 family)
VTVERRVAASLFPPPDYAHVAWGMGRIVFTAGAVPLDVEGHVLGATAAAQATHTIDNLLVALRDAGAEPEDIVKTTVYVVGDDLPAVWDVIRASPLAGAPSTLLGVAGLGYTGQLVEIEAVAIVG